MAHTFLPTVYCTSTGMHMAFAISMHVCHCMPGSKAGAGAFNLDTLWRIHCALQLEDTINSIRFGNAIGAAASGSPVRETASSLQCTGYRWPSESTEFMESHSRQAANSTTVCRARLTTLNLRLGSLTLKF